MWAYRIIVTGLLLIMFFLIAQIILVTYNVGSVFEGIELP